MRRGRSDGRCAGCLIRVLEKQPGVPPLRGATPRVPSAPGGSLVGIALFVNTFRELVLCLFGCLARVHFPMPSPLSDGADRLRLGEHDTSICTPRIDMLCEPSDRSPWDALGPARRLSFSMCSTSIAEATATLPDQLPEKQLEGTR